MINDGVIKNKKLTIADTIAYYSKMSMTEFFLSKVSVFYL